MFFEKIHHGFKKWTIWIFFMACVRLRDNHGVFLGKDAAVFSAIKVRENK
jgi:hypothetical protein